MKRLLVYANVECAQQDGLEGAALLARSRGAGLHVVDVVPDERSVLWVAAAAPDLTADLVSGRQERLRLLVSPLVEEGLEVSTDVLQGPLARTLIREAVLGEYDAIVKTAQGAGRLPYGSLALHLIRKSPRPVWIVRPESPGQKGVVAAVDAFFADRESRLLSVRILRAARELADDLGGELTVAYGWRTPGGSLLRGRLPADLLESFAARAREEARTSLAFLASDAGIRAPDHVEVEIGLPEEVIASTVGSRNPRVLVMGSVARTDLPGHFMGTTAEGVLARVDCSILTLKPEGFRSPIFG